MNNNNVNKKLIISLFLPLIFVGRMTLLRVASMVGVWGGLWLAGQQGLSHLGWTIPQLSAAQSGCMAVVTYIALGGYHTVYIICKTFRRDIVAGYRYVKVQALLKWAIWNNTNIPKLFMTNVMKNPNKVALIFEDQEWTFAKMDEYCNRVGNFLVDRGFQKGDSVALFMQNRPEYVCTWLGCAKVGVVPALINFNLQQVALLHSIKVADCKAVICGAEMQQAINDVKDELKLPIYVSGCDKTPVTIEGAESLDTLLNKSSPIPTACLDSVGIRDKLFYIYTSGTTGLPKAAIIRHARYVFFSTAVHYMTNMDEDDVIYNPLPLYHTAGGMVGMGQVLVFNNTAVIRRKFSASQYWIEAKKYGCTVGQYVGEICRYLLKTPPKPEDTQHKVRVMFGNGVRPQIWEQFTARFNNPCIAEFYGATEGIANIVNYEGKPGACGFVPAVLRGVLPVYLVKVDAETGEPYRDENGLCIICKPGEPGEFVGLIKKNDAARDFHGYADKKATQKKILKDVRTKGDTAFKSGDILVMDELGYLYFRDRTGDTFRWRGENVSSTEVEGIVSKVAGNKDAVVYGVEVPGAEGRAGMAAIVDPNEELDLEEFVQGLSKSLPLYARPLFIRVLSEIDVTGTFKLKKLALQKERFNPNIIKDKLYFLDTKLSKYVDLTQELYQKIEQEKAGL
ncbi:hypothetical protein Pmani_030308 [Petrolisthes manimaculis]|uniref:Very long-chain fatty acid transport protein n=1 Tax=Petrolisthes manimaculis TaxID=1843537 RepID=A0AAE1NXM9_9EUCA|nr:hypothetical protein Pmani_030308 [Petrolisthes manimaculis]